MTNTIPAGLSQDRYWASLIYLFKNHYRLNDCFTTNFFDMSDETIRIQALKRNSGPWSQSEKIMLNLALHLFNERNKFNLSDLDYLDGNNKKLAMEAIKIRFF
ncbi:hypothetical protein KDN24_05455 [Bacillus sp. Bva_UNVM-123]|uniref:hypothetical protein n=1 Tax=Bacillus sp. Bva_UNVM-123 TaxID=2829798 RepID=UPI00391F67AF